jgi:hypothetical protein
MRMQEPERWQQARQEEGQEGSVLGAAYTGRYYPEAQQEYIEVGAGDDYQEQKIHPQETVSSHRTVLRRAFRSTVADGSSAPGSPLQLPPLCSPGLNHSAHSLQKLCCTLVVPTCYTESMHGRAV